MVRFVDKKISKSKVKTLLRENWQPEVDANKLSMRVKKMTFVNASYRYLVQVRTIHGLQMYCRCNRYDSLDRRWGLSWSLRTGFSLSLRLSKAISPIAARTAQCRKRKRRSGNWMHPLSWSWWFLVPSTRLNLRQKWQKWWHFSGVFEFKACFSICTKRITHKIKAWFWSKGRSVEQGSIDGLLVLSCLVALI